MMRFFWMTFLPLSAAGGAAALLLWLARPRCGALLIFNGACPF